MGKKYGRIASFEQYMNVALQQRFNEINWNESYERFYNGDNTAVNGVQDKFRRDVDYFQEEFGKIERINNIIANETGIREKTVAMAIRNVVFNKLEKYIEQKLAYDTADLYSEIVKESDMSRKVEDDIIFRLAKISGHVSIDTGEDGINAPQGKYDDLDFKGQLKVCDDLMNMVLNTDACKDGNERFFDYPALNEVAKEVQEEALKIAKAVKGEKNSAYKPADERAKKDFNDLKDIYNKADKTDEDFKFVSERYVQTMEMMDNFSKFSHIHFNPEYKEAALELENTPVVGITAEQFAEKFAAFDRNAEAIYEARNKVPAGEKFDISKVSLEEKLSPSEIRWGENAIDNMVRGLYTDKEINDLKAAGLDPVMGIMVDGKPVEWFKKQDENESDALSNAKQKCGIVAKVIGGAKLDMGKFVPDGMGGFKLDALVPVKTDISMKTKGLSLWDWFMHLIGRLKTVKDKVHEANAEIRDYQANPENSKESTSMTNAERNTVKIQAQNALKKITDKQLEIDDEFFAQNLHDPENGTSIDPTSLFKFKGKDDTECFLVNTMGRPTSRANFAILYGMAQGYTYEQMMSGEGVDRKRLGEEFINEYAPLSYEKFVENQKKNNGAAKDDKTDYKKLYNMHILEKKDKLEQFLADCSDSFMRLPIPNVDPNLSSGGNITEKLDNLAKLSHFGTLHIDCVQMFAPLRENDLDENDKTVTQSYKRSENVAKLVDNKTSIVQKIGNAADKYMDFICSDAITKEDFDGTDIKNIAIASKSKAFLSELYHSRSFGRFGEIFNGDSKKLEEMNKLSATCTSALDTNITNGEMLYYTAEQAKEMRDNLCSKTPNPNLVKVDLANGTVKIFNTQLSLLNDPTTQKFKDAAEKYNAEVNEYLYPKDKKGLLFSEIHAMYMEEDNKKIFGLDNEPMFGNLFEEVTFDELAAEINGPKKETATNNPVKKESEIKLEKGLEMTSLGK